MDITPSEVISGLLDKILFQDSTSGFTVASIKINSKEFCVARGIMPNIIIGESVSLVGNWTTHPKFGRQFEVQQFTKKLPSSVEGIRRYLSSGLIKGIGKTYADKLVEKFGAEVLEIIDKNPSRLYSVEGFGEKRVTAIIEAWQTQKEISNVMVFLQEKGITTDFAVKIFKTYGHKSIEKIQENPYRLSDDIWGVGFKTADKIALKLGLAKDSIERIKAAIIFSISDVINEGHLYIKVNDCKEKVKELLELENNENLESLLKNSLSELFNQEKIKLITYQDQHFITLPQYYFSEKGIASKIKYLKDGIISNEDLDLGEIYKKLRLPDSIGIELNEEQQRGIISCLQNKVTIITGGPGTGKTTLIKKLLEILEEYNFKYKLAAPTGRAAKRIFEGTSRNAETLHRLLEFNPATLSFSRNEQNALDVDFLIVDEASMIDVFLMHSLLRALPYKGHIVLLGDIDQLPSVGAGNVLNDLIASGIIEVIRLVQIFRQAQDSLIIVNAHRINNGEFPITYKENSKKDFKYVKLQKGEDIFGILNTLYTVELKKFGIDKNDSIVLCPMNRGVVGTSNINQHLQHILNPPNNFKPQVTRFSNIYRLGDRVMQIKNNYDKFIFNGDMGYIVEIKLEESELLIKFGERSLTYDFTDLDEIVLAYAISIHKSQGSEFKAVIIPVFMQHFVMLKRNLLYTAITRAKKLCIFMGEARAIAMGIKNNKSNIRNTFLVQFLTSDLSAR